MVTGLVLAFAAPVVHTASYKCMDLSIKPTKGLCKGVERKGKYCVGVNPSMADGAMASKYMQDMLDGMPEESCKDGLKMSGFCDAPKDGFCKAAGDKQPGYCTMVSYTRAGPDIPCSSDADCTDEKMNQKQCCSSIKTYYSAACGDDTAKGDQVMADQKAKGYCDADKCTPLTPYSAASAITPGPLVAFAVSTACALVMATAS